MFHLARDASKVALVHLVARLRRGGFRLLDTQFVTASSGQPRRDRDQPRRLLANARTALTIEADFEAWPAAAPMAGRAALAALGD